MKIYAYAVFNSGGEKYAERIVKRKDPLGISGELFYLLENSGNPFDYGHISLTDLMRTHRIKPGNIRYTRPKWFNAQLRKSKRMREVLE